MLMKSDIKIYSMDLMILHTKDKIFKEQKINFQEDNKR